MSFGPFPNDPGLGGNVVFGLAANAPAAGTVPAGYQYVATDADTVTYYSATGSYTIGGGGQGTPALLRTASGNNATSAGPINTVGSNLIVVMSTNGGTVTDSAGNTYSKAASYTSGATACLWYCTNPTTSATHTFSITGNATFFQVGVFVNANGALNISANGQASAGPGSTIVANELVVAGANWGNGDGVTSCTMAGFTLASGTLDNATYSGSFLFYVVKATVGTITATPTLTGGTPYGDGTVMASFLP